MRSLVSLANRLPRERAARWLLAGFALTLLFGAAATRAPAQVALFYSPDDNGVDPGVPLTLPDGLDQSLPLYLDGGASPSTSQVCEQGDGDEICGWLIRLQASDGVTIQGFVPDAGAGTEWNAEPGELRATGGNATTGSLGSTRLGHVVVDIEGTGELALVTGSVARSGLTLEAIPPRPLLLPEPGVSCWPACIAGLASLARRRGRRHPELPTAETSAKARRSRLASEPSP